MKTSKKARISILTLGLCGVVCAPLLTGCGKGVGTSSSLSPQEAKSFKGGPMPPEAQREIAKRMQMNQQRMQQTGQTPPPAGAGQPK